VNARSRRLVRPLLAVVAAWLVAFVSLPANAQDPRDSTVQAAARQWLALIDRGDVAGSWNAAGRKFQQAIGMQRWVEGMKEAREPLGAVAQRAAAETRYDKSFGGAPPGDYAFVLFRTSFANEPNHGETVTLEREADGVWRVIGYAIT
jgi:hypothetical protein